MPKVIFMFKQLTVCRRILACACISVAASLSACGGGGGSSDGAGGATTVLAEKDLTASQPGELLTYVRTKLKEQAKLQEFASSSGPAVGVLSSNPMPLATQSSAPSTSGSNGDSAVAAFSSTTLQEVGVDEDDLMKTDGNMIYAMTMPSRASYGTTGTVPARLLAYQRTDAGVPIKTASIDLPNTAQRSGMYLVSQAKKIAVIGASSTFVASNASASSLVTKTSPPFVNPTPQITPGPAPAIYPIYIQKDKVDIALVDTSNANSLPISKTISIDGTLVGSRVIDNILYLATSHTPQIPVTPTAIDAVKASDIVPTIQIDSGAAMPLFSDTDCYVQAKNASAYITITTITAIDLSSSNLARNSRCFVGGSEAIYVSEKSVYVATTRYSYASPANVADVSSPILFYPADIKTDIHKFSIRGLSVVYKASAEVKGHLGWDPAKKSYRMSEYGDDLRVITFTGELGWGFLTQASATQQPTSTVASPATLTILRDSGTDLKAIGSLPNSKRPQPLGLPNEQVYAVRFLGDKGFVVTFRRSDPLYTLDLSDPTDPKAAGELKTPGFSDYLFPVGANLLLGVGKDASETGLVLGVKIGLIDISDLAKPKEIATRLIGKQGSASALDASAHGINLFTVNGVTRVAIPIRVNETPNPNGFPSFKPTYQSLFRFEVDALSKTLTDKAPLSGTPFSSPDSWGTPGLYDVLGVGNSRSVQIADEVYFLNGGVMTGGPW